MKWLMVIGIAAVAVGCEAPTPTPVSPAPIAQTPPATQVTENFAVPVLMYHRICDLSPRESRSPLLRDLSVSPADFEEQVKFLKDEGFSFLYVSEVEQALREGKPLPEKAVAITMDDGYQDNFGEALPILEKHGAKATVFMVSSNFEKPGRLTLANAKQMITQGFSFESHSKTHPDLTTLDDGNLRDELVDSKQTLESNLKIKVNSIAYPAGAFNEKVIEFADAAGYVAAWKKGGGAVRPAHATEPFKLPRIRVHGRTDLEKFKQRVTSGLEILAMQRRIERKSSS